MKGAQLALPVQLRDTASFDSYYAGPNLDAVRALQELTQPVVIFGAPGSGRSHLLQASCRAHRGAYLPLDQLHDAGVDVLGGYENSSTLFIDDTDTILDQRRWCIALLRTLDAVRINGGRYVIALNRAPEHSRAALPDLTTRLQQCLVFGLKPLDDQHRAELLQLRAHHRGFNLPQDVTRWLLNTLPRDTGSLLHALDQLDHNALRAKRRITLPFAHAVLDPADEQTAPD